MKQDDLGDRMKMYEMSEAGRRLMPCLPIMARLDGRSFHSFCKGLTRPYDLDLSSLMIKCVKYLVKETNACCGYTQSDEITLTWYAPNIKTQTFFNGRISKIVSTLAAMQSVYFNSWATEYLGGKYAKKLPVFDCRVWNVPNMVEGTNAFLWREQDATKNSISMAARAYYSHKEVENKNGVEMQDMLMKKGINWNDYPVFFKRGTYIQKRVVKVPFSSEEIDKLPAKHKAKLDPSTLYERTKYMEVNMPPLSKVVNRVEVIYEGADPICLSE
jgi:tRNA(His) guanylyltransferase